MRRLAVIALTLFVLSGCMTREKMEEQLRLRLLALRAGMDSYTYDKGYGPESLDELVRTGYLKEIPEDPCTGKRDWTVITCEHYRAIPDPKNPQRGLCRVQSACKKTTEDGTPYSTW